MLVYLSHQEIDYAKWDTCLENAAYSIVYGYSWYLDIVSPNWDGIVKLENGRYTAIMPIPVRKKFGIIKYVIQPIFAQQLGVFSEKQLTKEEWGEIASMLRKRFWFISSYSFNIDNTEILESGLPGFNSCHYNTYLLSLRASYQAIVAGYRKDRRWRLHQTQRLNLKVVPSKDVDLMVKLFDENTAPRISGVIGETYEYRMLRAIYNQASLRNMIEMYEIQDAGGAILAMAMMLYFKKQIIYIFNTSSAAGKKQGAIAALLDNFFESHSERDFCFDFESPEVANVASFYSSFGSKKQPFLTISLDNLPIAVRWLKQVRYNIYKQVFRK